MLKSNDIQKNIFIHCDLVEYLLQRRGCGLIICVSLTDKPKMNASKNILQRLLFRKRIHH